MCEIEGCGAPRRYRHPVDQRGLCGKHYQRLRNHGSLDDPKPSRTQRFWSKVRVRGSEDCWPWLGGCDSHGYGNFSNTMAHRVAYEMTTGPVPEGKHLDHTCHNNSDCKGGKGCLHRRCVNPRHLDPIEPIENQFRSGRSPAAQNALKTHCPQGHEYSEDNTRHYAGRRVCKACKRVAKFCKAVGGNLAHTVPSSL
jgi:hypothetical protein